MHDQIHCLRHTNKTELDFAFAFVSVGREPPWPIKAADGIPLTI